MAAVNGHTNGVNGLASGLNGHANGINGQLNGNSPRAESRQKSKLAGIRPDGYPRLPPIAKPNNPQRDDPYANSKLMTFRLANHKQALLMKVL